MGSSGAVVAPGGGDHPDADHDILAALFPHIRYKTGDYYTSQPAGISQLAQGAQDLVVMPFDGPAMPIDRIGVEVNTVAANSTVRILIYANGADGYPGALLVDGGANIDSSATGGTGLKESIVAATLPAGRKWVGVLTLGGAPTLNSNASDFTSPNAGLSVPSTGATITNGWRAVGVSSVPNPFPTGAARRSGCPRVVLRKAA